MNRFALLLATMMTSNIALSIATVAETTPQPKVVDVTVSTAVAAVEEPALPPDQIQVVEVNPGILKQLTSGTFWLQLGAFFALLLVFMRSLAQLLLWVSAKTENKSDDKLAKAISDATWYLGVLVSKAGWSTPTVVIEEKAKQLPKT